MAKTNLKLAHEKTLEEMIDEYGFLSQQKNAIGQRQKYLKQQIDAAVVLPEGERETVVEGESYKAEKYLPEKTIISPQGVYEYDQDTFWRIARITLTDAQAVLPGDVLHAVTTVEIGSIPQLKISRKQSIDDY